MCKNIEKQIFNYLSENLTPKKLEHSYNVAMLAADLASRHSSNDTLKARTAGLLHDCAKLMTDKELIDFFKKRNKTLKYFKDISKFSPHLLHSFAGGNVAKEKFKIKDKDILNAIKNHTLGRENMSVLEKIIFVADYVSRDRKWKYAKRIRNLAKNDLNKAFFEALIKKMEYVINNSMWMCPQIIDTWNWYVSNGKKDN